jgi:type VI protein secretion system component Hcp
MATDLFLKLSRGGAPIKGECQDQPFQGMIQLQAFQMSSLALLTRPEKKVRPAASGPSPGWAEQKPAAVDDSVDEDACSFTVTKALDSSSTDLFLNYTQAQNPEKRKACLLRGTVYFRHDGPQPKVATPEGVSFLALDFYDMFVYDYSLEGNQEDPRPVEEVKFYFDKYMLTYKAPYLAAGMALKPPCCIGWDFNLGEPL